MSELKKFIPFVLILLFCIRAMGYEQNNIFNALFPFSLFLMVIALVKPSYAVPFIPHIKRGIIFAVFIPLFIISLIFAHKYPKVSDDKEIAPSPTITVIPTAQPTITLMATSEAQLEKVNVIRIVDGDTIIVTGNKRVRYIGIDTPETVDPRKPVQCFGKEASTENTKLVGGKEIYLEKDVSETDIFGRLLRYAYVNSDKGTKIMINEYLVENGFAHAVSYPPDIKYQQKFTEAQKKARMEKKGLWADNVCITPNNTSSSFVCNCNKSCTQISSCEEAQYQLNICGCTERDGDHDGTACDGAPLHCQN